MDAPGEAAAAGVPPPAASVPPSAAPAASDGGPAPGSPSPALEEEEQQEQRQQQRQQQRGGGGGGARGGARGGRVRGRRGAAADPPPPEDIMRLTEVKVSERMRTGWHPVRLSAEDKAADVALDGAQLRAFSRRGYRMVRATHGASSGTWYFEVKVEALGPSGAARLGWATRRAEVNAPVGTDSQGYAYRSTQGSKVHKAWRDEYGAAYGEGDVVGCLIHLGEGGRPFEPTLADVVEYQKVKFYAEPADAPPPDPQPLPGSLVAFALNGELQGTAYGGVLEGTWYPAVSLYTDPSRQAEAASVSVNFGDRPWAFPPPALEGCPPPRPVSELPGPRPGAADVADGAGAAGDAGAAGNAGAHAMQQQQQQQQDKQQPQQQAAAAAAGAAGDAMETD